MHVELKDVFKQVYELGKNEGNLREYWNVWDGSPELLDCLKAYLKLHEEPTNQNNNNEQ